MTGHKKEWTKEEVIKLYNKPLLQLVFDAAKVHREHHDPTAVSYTHLTLPTIYSV